MILYLWCVNKPVLTKIVIEKTIILLPSIANLIERQHNDVQIVQQRSLLYVFLQYQTDRVVQTVEHRHENQFVLVRAAHHVEEQIDVVLVHTGEAVEHDDLGVEPMRLGEERLLEGLLFLERGKGVFVVVLGENAVAVAVQDEHALDGEQSGFLHKVVTQWICWLENIFEEKLYNLGCRILSITYYVNSTTKYI